MAPLKRDTLSLTVQALHPYNTAHAGAVFITHREVFGRSITDHERRIAKDLARKDKLSDLQRVEYLTKAGWLVNNYPFRLLSLDARATLELSPYDSFDEGFDHSSDADAVWMLVKGDGSAGKGGPVRLFALKWLFPKSGPLTIVPEVTAISAKDERPDEGTEELEGGDWEVIGKVEEGWTKV